MTLDSKAAAAALDDIESMAQKVRQSQFYQIFALTMILWGALVLAGNLATFIAPSYAPAIWILVNLLGVAGTFGIVAANRGAGDRKGQAWRQLTAFGFYFTFGFLCIGVLGNVTPRQSGAFWPIYFMLAYMIAGLWLGRALVFIGAVITALTLIGYFFVLGGWFLIWMAAVNGGGLIVAGLWMRRA